MPDIAPADNAGAEWAAWGLVHVCGQLADNARVSLTLAELLRRLLQDLCLSTPWIAGRANLVDERGEVSLAAEWPQGLDGEAAQGFSSWAVADPQPRWLPDITAIPDPDPYTGPIAAGARSVLTLPVLADGVVAAVIELFGGTDDPPNEALVTGMTALGSLLGLVLERDRELRQAIAGEERAQHVLDTAADAFVAMDAAGIVTHWNGEAERIFGWTRAEAVGQPMAELIVPVAYRADHLAAVHRFLTTGDGVALGTRAELEGVRRSGELFPLEIVRWSLEIDTGWSFYAFIRDITERKSTEAELDYRREREAELTHRTLHDELTGLANRRLAVDRVTEALIHRRRYGGEVAVIFVDLDRFKLVNDSLGHDAGDDVLCAVAYRLRAAVRESDTVARVAGDEFVVVCRDLTSRDEAKLVAQRILSAMHAPIDVSGEQVRVGASIGIAFADAAGSPTTSDDAHAGAEALLRAADAAMYRVKEEGRGHIVVFDESMRTRQLGRVQLERELVHCVDRDELVMRYRPIHDVHTNALVGVGIASCWEHPRLGLVEPEQFLPIAEEGGLIGPIRDWVLRVTSRDVRRMQLQSGLPLRVTANLSIRHITDFRFVPGLVAALSASELDPATVEISIEAPSLQPPHDPGRLAEVIGTLRSVGVRVAIGRVGTGFALPPVIKLLRPDTIKLAAQFVTSVVTDRGDQSIIRATAAMAHDFGATVMAQGVDSPEQLRHVAELGCDHAMGDALGGWVEEADVEQWWASVATV